MIKNYKLLLLALLSTAAPVFAMSQDEEKAGEQARAKEKARIKAFAQLAVAKYGPKNAELLSRSLIQAGEKYERQQNGERLAPPLDNTMIYCANCNEAHKRPQRYIFSESQDLIEVHPCFTIPYQNGEIEPITIFC